MRCSAFVVALGLALSSPALAQKQNPVEFGLDGSLGYGLDSPHVTTVSLPVTQVRVGFFVSPTVSIEPTAALLHSSVDGASGTTFDLGVGALFHFSAARSAVAPYVRPFIAINRVSFDDNFGPSSVTTTSLGAGMGFKAPISDRFAWRLEGALSHSLETDFTAPSTRLLALIGVSVFTH